MIRKDAAKNAGGSSGLIPRAHVRILTETAAIGPKNQALTLPPLNLADAVEQTLAASALASESHAHATEGEDEPQIRLIREGDTVKAIEVICTCGKRTILNCVY